MKVEKEREANFVVNQEISVAQLTTLGVAIAYVSGYLINGFFLRNHGLVQVPIVDSLYIEIGLVFALVTGVVAVVPVATLKWAIRERRESGLSLNAYTYISPFIAANYLYVLTFSSIFLTYYDWVHTTEIAGVVVSMRYVFPVYFILLFLLMALISLLRRTDFRSGSPKRWRMVKGRDNGKEYPLLKVALHGFRISAILATIVFDYLLFQLIPWFGEFLWRGTYFIFWLVIGVLSVAIISHFGKQYERKNHKLTVWLISFPFVLAFYYFTVIAYANGV